MIWKKTISVILVCAFFLSSVPCGALPSVFAETSAKQETKEVTTNPESIIVPREFGIIKSHFTGKSGKLIVHIQDAHCNYEAQSNIAKVIENLIKNNGLSFVSVEGADGLIDTSWFKSFPDAEVRKEVATYFMKKGEITGPEFLSITTDYPIKLFGAETREYYIENLNAFTASYPLKEETEKYFNSIRAALNKLKGFIYNTDLKAMDEKGEAYEAKSIQFNDYVRFLQTEAEKHSINLRQYENLFKLINVLAYEKKIDFSLTDKERSVLIDQLSKVVTKDVLKELVNKSVAFKVGKVTSAEYYEYVKALAAQNNVDMAAKYPNLYNYIIYNSVYSRIDNEKLFHDIKVLEADIKEKLFENDDQRTLEKLSRYINTLIGLVNIKLLNGDFEYYKAHKDEFSPEAFDGFIKDKSIQFGFAFAMEPPSDAVERSMAKLEDFYIVAIKRDSALVDNTLEGMAKANQNLAVLVTGGFHSEGMTKLLEKADISYVVVCPAITKDVPTPYIQILTNQRTSFEDILVGGREARQGMLAAAVIAWARTAIDDPHVAKIARVRVEDVENGWIQKCVELWLAKALQLAGTDRITRDLNSMKDIYRTAMRSVLMEQGRTPAEAEEFIANIMGRDIFTTTFDTTHDALVPKNAVVGITPVVATSSAGEDRHENMASDYAKGNLIVPTYPIQRMFRISDADLDLTRPDAASQQALLETAVKYLADAARKGEKIGIWIMAGGEATRIKQGDYEPPIYREAQRLEPERYGDPGTSDKLPDAKAMLPAAIVDGKVIDFLRLHLINVQRMNDACEAAGLGRPFVAMVMDNERYHAIFKEEIAKLEKSGIFGYRPQEVLYITQPLGYRIAATEADVRANKVKFKRQEKSGLINAAASEAAFEKALEFARANGGTVLRDMRTAEGHGDYFHCYLLPSREYGGKTMLDIMRERKIRYNSVRNLDNMAILNEALLMELGLMVSRDAALLFEVSRRPKGSAGAGGGFVVGESNGPEQMEDDVYKSSVGKYGFNRDADEKTNNPNGDNPTPVNNATLLVDTSRVFTANYGGEELEEALAMSDSAARNAKLGELAQRGREKFGLVPTFKVVKGPGGSPIATIAIETRAWDIQKGVKDVPGAIAVVNTASTVDVQEGRVTDKAVVRFDPLKSKEDYGHGPDGQLLQSTREAIVQAAVKGSLVSDVFNNLAKVEVGAVRAKGGELTAAEHIGEDGVNAAIGRLIKRSRYYAMAVAPMRFKKDDDVPLKMGMPNMQDLTRIQGDNLALFTAALHSKADINFIVLQGLKDELKSTSAVDLVLHPGRGRHSVYLDESDFLYLLSLRNGVELITDALAHERAHIEKPELSEAAVEEIAPTYELRKALLMRDGMTPLEMNLKLAIEGNVTAYDTIVAMPRQDLINYFESDLKETIAKLPEDMFGFGSGYDVRGNAWPIKGGVVDLTPANMYLVGKLLGTRYAKPGDKALLTGDIRLHTPILRYCMALGVSSVGVNVEYAPDFLTTGAHNLMATENSGGYKFMVQVSGSHGAAPKNGFKIKVDLSNNKVLEPLYAEKLEGLYKERSAVRTGVPAGTVTQTSGIEQYVVNMLNETLPATLKDEIVVIDPRAGAAGPIITALLEKRDFTIIDMDKVKKSDLVAAISGAWGKGSRRIAVMLNMAPDGTMSRGIWDPSLPEALDPTQRLVKLINANIDKNMKNMPRAFGGVFDGDADRISAIDETGRAIPAFEMTLPYYQRFLIDPANQAAIAKLAEAGAQPIKIVCDVRANSKLLSLIDNINRQLQAKAGITDRNIIEGVFITTGYPPQLGFMQSRIAELEKFVADRPVLKNDPAFIANFNNLKRTYFTAEASGHNFFHISKTYPSRVCDCAISGFVTLMNIRETIDRYEAPALKLTPGRDRYELAELFDKFPPAYSSREVTVDIPNNIKIATARKIGAWMKDHFANDLKPYSDAKRENDYTMQPKDDGYVTVAGFKVQLKDGRTALVRWSNTSEKLTTIFEGRTPADLVSITREITERLRQEGTVNIAPLDKEIARLQMLEAQVPQEAKPETVAPAYDEETGQTPQPPADHPIRAAAETLPVVAAGKGLTENAILPAAYNIENDTTALGRTLLGLGINTTREKKRILIVYDTMIDENVNTAHVARASEALINRKLSDEIVVIRGAGPELLAKIRDERNKPGAFDVVVTIAGDSLVTSVGQENIKDMGTVINVYNPGSMYVPVVGLFDLALRIAYDMGDERILECLNRIAVMDPLHPELFTIDALRRGVIRILPKIRPVDMAEAVAGYKAAQAAVTSL